MHAKFGPWLQVALPFAIDENNHHEYHDLESKLHIAWIGNRMGAKNKHRKLGNLGFDFFCAQLASQ